MVVMCPKHNSVTVLLSPPPLNCTNNCPCIEWNLTDCTETEVQLFHIVCCEPVKKANKLWWSVLFQSLIVITVRLTNVQGLFRLFFLKNQCLGFICSLGLQPGSFSRLFLGKVWFLNTQTVPRESLEPPYIYQTLCSLCCSTIPFVTHLIIHWVIESSSKCSKYHKSHTVRARELTFWENVHPPILFRYAT